MDEASDKRDGQGALVNVDLDRLAAYLRQDLRVAAALAFGSARDGQIRPGSDLDLAVLFDQTLSAAEFLEFYTELCDQIPQVETVDLIRLQQANPILAFEALNGRFLCVNNQEKMAAFFSLVCREYEDVMANLEDQRRLVA